MQLKIVPFLLIGSAVLSGCQQNTNNIDAPSIQKSEAAAVVNGQFISKTSLNELTKEVSQRSHGQKIPKDKLIDELIKRELLVQEAKSKKLDQSPEMKARFAMMKNSLLSQAAIQDFIKANPVTEADLKAEYDKQIGHSGNEVEYKARHILVKTEEEAKAVIAQLNKGADFVEMAKTTSIGPSKTQGGDLGWFAAKQMVAPFSEAVAKLDNGQYTKTPVKTQFGWHIIIREDSRKQTPPPFEAVKAQLEPLVQRQKLTHYLEALRKGAQVEILVPLTDEPVTPPSPTVEKTTENTEKEASKTVK